MTKKQNNLVFIFVFVSLLMIVMVLSVSAQENGPLREVDLNGQQSRSLMATGAINPASGEELAQAMGVPSSDLMSADLMGSDPAGAGVSDSGLGEWFPTEGNSFAILSTGKAADADLPNSEGDHSNVLAGLNSDNGHDLVRLHMKLKVPNNINCASFDFAFYSEEFPEFVGSQFNDTFTAQLNEESLVTEGNAVIAPGNFAFDTEGGVISVNTVFGVSGDTGTTYDGSTPLLRARTAVVPSSTIDIYLSIQDLGDSIYDSAVFLDRFFWSKDPSCTENGAQVDTDGDGLLDVWENNGLTVNVGGVDEFIDLPAMGADPNHKDIFIEIDSMVAAGHHHRPNPHAIEVIVDAFDNAPVQSNDSDPADGIGIHLHVDYGPTAPLTWGAAATWGALSHGEDLAHRTYISTCTGTSFNWGGTTSFDSIKEDHFTAGRAAVFHYNIWAHSLCAEKGTTSGISRNSSTTFTAGGSDFIVSLGGWANTDQQQAGTFMHELGHNLGLRHGGTDHVNYKPNYLSVMNYAFQTRGLIMGGTQTDNFDYSRYILPSLDENDLDEPDGIGVSSSLGTYKRCPSGVLTPENDASAMDWNCDGDETDTGIAVNINNSGGLTVLTTHNDWDHITFLGGAISLPGASIELPAQSEVIDIDRVEDSKIPSAFPTVYLPAAFGG